MLRLIGAALLCAVAHASTIGYARTSGSFVAEIDTWTEYTITSGGDVRVTAGDPWFQDEERTFRVVPPVIPVGSTITDWHFSIESYDGRYMAGSPEQYNLLNGEETMLWTRPISPYMGESRAPDNLPFWPSLVAYAAATPSPDAPFDLSVLFLRDIWWYGPTGDYGENAETAFRVDLQHTIPYEWRLQVFYESPDVHTPEPSYALPLLLALGLLWRQSRN
jgi:hypothetical protein